jgi:hypothetical protein
MTRESTFKLSGNELATLAGSDPDAVRHELQYRRNRGAMRKLAEHLGVTAGTKREGKAAPAVVEIAVDHVNRGDDEVQVFDVEDRDRDRSGEEPGDLAPDGEGAPPEPVNFPECDSDEGLGALNAAAAANPCRPCGGKGGFASGLVCRTCKGSCIAPGVAPKWRYVLPSFVAKAVGQGGN